MLTKTLSEAKKKQRNILIKAMNNDIGSIDSAKDSWNPAQISERAKDISYIRSLVDTWNPAQLNEALKMLDLPVIDTWNPAQIEEQRRNLVFYLSERTLTGNPITLKILGNLTPEITGLKVTMNPIQDFHGYDYPWVGGAGKNLLDFTTQTITSSKTIASDIQLKAGTYTVAFNIKNMTSIEGYYSVRIGTTSLGGINFTANYNNRLSKTFTLSEDSTVNIFVAGASSGYSFEFSNGQIESGSTATDFAPYSNICPISGRTEASVTRTGKNLLDKSGLVQGSIQATGTDIADTNRVRSGYVKVFPNTVYTISTHNSDNLIVNFHGYSEPNTESIQRPTQAYNVQSLTITTGSGVNYIRILIRNAQGNTVTPSDILTPMLELGSTATAYEPYTAETKTHQYSETIYGGVDDFVNGGLTNEWGYIASYDGETLPGVWISDRDVYAPDTTPSTGAEVVYRLETPTTIETTPEEIALLKGTNVLSTDGDSIELKYKQNF